MALPVSLDEIQAMHRDAQARGDSPGMANVVLLAGASGECLRARTPTSFLPDNLQCGVSAIDARQA